MTRENHALFLFELPRQREFLARYMCWVQIRTEMEYIVNLVSVSNNAKPFRDGMAIIIS